MLQNFCRTLIATLLACLATASGKPAVAFFYGAQPPINELRAFDWVVLEPDHFKAAPAASPETDWFAYVSVGEVEARRSYAGKIPSAWLPSSNPAWGGKIIDQSQPEWPAFFVEQIITPLWQQGWRHFFLDTLDSWQLLASTPAEQAAQQAGLIRTLKALKARYPEAKLLFNRGFEVLPEVHGLAAGVAFESLEARWQPANRQYSKVPEADRAWLLQQIKPIQEQWKLPVIAIDYVPAGDRQQAREVAARIRAHGLIPWVATPELDILGVGQVEVQPRRVLVLYDSAQYDNLMESDHVRFLATPLNYLGLVPEYVDVQQPLPSIALAGRYAGIVSWLNGDLPSRAGDIKRLFDRARNEGVPLAILSRFGFNDPGWMAQRGISVREGNATEAVRITRQHTAVGFEHKPYPQRDNFEPMKLNQGEAWLSLASGDLQQDPVGITTWGGYALGPYVVELAPGDETDTYWVIQPLEFLKAALQLPAMPIADTTTENGRRLWLTHIDGDGFPSLAEIPGSPTAAEVMRRDFIERYRVPHTVSVIEGETSPNGLWSSMAKSLETTSRAIFALPHVEVASHTYSHPFFWQALTGKRKVEGSLYGMNLQLKDYKFSVDREISGSAAYINSRLAPPGKQVKVLLWSGDCDPDGETVAATYKAGLRNMNAGDTTITRAHPSWTRISSLGLDKGGGNFQIFAPNQNENIYTNDWKGPYWGFRRVIETFELTDKPYRFKPINIYYHTYSASRKASIEALHQVYRYALSQETLPLYASAYIDRVIGFNQVVVAKTDNGWRIRNQGALRTVRLPESATPDFATSQGIAGWRVQPQGRYLHLSGQQTADIVVAAETGKRPYLIEANAHLATWQPRADGVRFKLDGGVPLQWSLAHDTHCTLSQAGRPLKPLSRTAAGTQYKLAEQVADLDLACSP